ncbi:MAG: hypothetical protein NWP69_03520 [Congregibacter sp.]|nr:hypothetical protein [Congregibacter sp.]
MTLYTSAMATEHHERYDIAFGGECLEGHDPLAVREALGALFKADEATLDRLFSGTRQRIKRNCDKATALKYQKSLAAAGAKAIVSRVIEEGQKNGESGETGESESLTAASVGPDGDSPLELLPGGSDILRPEERIAHAPAVVDVAHLTLAATGERLAPQASSTVSPVHVPEFDVAEPGAQIAPPAKPGNDAIAPDTSKLDLAPAGDDLGGSTPSGTAKADVNTDHLNLAEPGSDLLLSHERKITNAQAPDTSHLTLDPSEPPTSS